MFKYILLFICSFSLSRVAAQVNLDSSLIACYALNGNAYDPINNLSGTNQNIGATANRFNVPNSASNFSCNAAALIALPNSSLLKPQNLSFSVWLRPTVGFYARSYILYSAFNGTAAPAIALTREKVGNISVLKLWKQGSTSASTLQTTTNLMFNAWSHVACVISNTLMVIYVNGVVQASVATQGGIQYNPSATIYLGGTNEANHNEPYCGDMDNVRFYNRAISAQEVNLLYTTDPACVTVTATPVANFTANPPYCANQPIQFNDLSANAPGTWQWTSSAGQTPNAFLPNPVFTYTSAGVVQVSLQVTNSLGTSSAVSVLTIAPQPSLTVAQNPTIACRQMPATITATGANSYTWSPVAFAGASYSFYVAGQLSYTVTGASAEGCVSSKTIQVKSVICHFFPGLGLTDLSQDAEILIVKPDKETIVISSVKPMYLDIRVYTLDGRLLEAVNLCGETRHSIKTAEQDCSIYFFEIIRNGNRIVKKIAF